MSTRLDPGSSIAHTISPLKDDLVILFWRVVINIFFREIRYVRPGPSIDLRRKTDFRFAALYPADLAEPLISPEKVPSSLSVLRIIIRYVFPIQPGSSSGLNTNVSCDTVLGSFTAVVGSTKRMSSKSGFPGSGGRESKIE